MKYKANGFISALLLGSMLLIATPVLAKGNFDGSSDLVCATFDVVGCMDADNCTSGPARNYDLPVFLDIQFKRKVIHITYDGGEMEAESPINNMEVNGSQLVLQGVENGHGWTMAIHKDTGRMSVGVVSDELSFTIFGACKAN